LVQEETGHVDIQDVDTTLIHDKIVANLKEVYDPEIPVNIYDLGLIYNIDINNQLCKITMSLTSAFCPAADDIIADVQSASNSVPGIDDVDVNITFDPQWGPEMMSEDCKLILGIF
jgi:metal-sulfur cluster biosynthetic enzyme